MKRDMHSPHGRTARPARMLALAAVLAGAAACSDAPTSAPPSAASGPAFQTVASGDTVMTGVMAVQWGDPEAGGTPRLMATLRSDRGEVVRLGLDGATLAAAGGVHALDGRTVEIRAARAGARFGAVPSLAVRTVRVTGSGVGGRPPAGPRATPASVALPYVTILCRFADTPTLEPRAKSAYDSWMGSTYPGLDQYWRQMSYDRINLSGSLVVGWYTLPRTRAEYLEVDGSAKLDLLATDCTGAADPDVDFTAFAGINTQYNQSLDCCSWGGAFTLDYDGAVRLYPFTWMGDWAGQSVYAHEIGHSLGFPHSSGPYGQTYDSRWDVMSNAGVLYDDALQSWIGQGTIAYHRDLAGWIPPWRKLTVTRGFRRVVALDRLVEPRSTPGHLLVQIPITNAPGQFYTLEARARVGYDGPIPGDAVIIHRVNPLAASHAIVVDSDGNGDPNDAGAMWTVGETFADPANGITVEVRGTTSTGFRLMVSHR